jgi:hypothetical protein
MPLKRYAIKTWGSGSIAPSLLTSALDGGQWSASCPCHFTPGEKSSGTNLISLCGLQSRSTPCEIEPGPSRLSPSLYRLTYPDSIFEVIIIIIYICLFKFE